MNPSRHRKSILFVSPRWGTVVGGAEALLRGFATRLAAQGEWSIEVATTAATDEDRWGGAAARDSTFEDGVLVHKFPCVGPSPLRARLSRTVLRSLTLATVFDQAGWRPATVACPELARFLLDTRDRWHAVVAAPYLHGTTRITVAAVPERTVLIPCLHDEPAARLPSVGAMLRSVPQRYFNSAPEQQLASAFHGAEAAAGRVVGVGIDPPGDFESETELRQKFGLEGDFIIFAGRAVPGKGVDRLVTLVREYNRMCSNQALTLVLVGGGTYRPSPCPWIRWLGPVSEPCKNGLIALSLATASMSRLESLSLLILEGWAHGTPAIVAADSQVLAWQVSRCGGGFAVSGPNQFALAIDQLRKPEVRSACAQAGGRLVQDEYSWEHVLARFIAGLPAGR